MARVTLIVAKSHNDVIGDRNGLPWRLPEDLAHFKRTTIGHPVVMGRKTWDSIGKPLPNRRNIVVTRNAAWAARGAERAGSLAEALALCASADEVFVIGGAQIFIEALLRADRLIVTEIDQDFEGDAYFAAIDPNLWREVSRDRRGDGSNDSITFSFVHYARRSHCD